MPQQSDHADATDIAIAAHEFAAEAHRDAIRRRSEIARSDAMAQSTTAREETAEIGNGAARAAAEQAETEAVRARETTTQAGRNACHRRAAELHEDAIRALQDAR